MKWLREELESTDEYYLPVLLDNDNMGIGLARDDDRPYLRRMFREELFSRGVRGLAIGIYLFRQGGQYLLLMQVFKIPPKHHHDAGSGHDAKLAAVVEKCRSTSPTLLAKSELKRINNLLQNTTGIPDDKANAIRKLITGDSNKAATECEEAAYDMISKTGEISESLFMDLRFLNSHGNMGGGAMSFDLFWEKCNEIFDNEDGGAAHERRDADAPDVIYASKVMSLEHLVSRALEKLQDDVNSGKLEKLPPIPSTDLVWLQFVPNNNMAKTAARMTGKLHVKQKVQSCTARNVHPDQHHVNTTHRYHLEWSIDLKHKSVCLGLPLNQVEVFAGQDDKCKIPVGNHVPVSTNVRYNKKAIVPLNDINSINAADHDWSCANIVPSVTLFSNIPNTMYGSFFGGGVGVGTGEIEVVLRDATFDASDVMNHTAQLAASIKS